MEKRKTERKERHDRCVEEKVYCRQEGEHSQRSLKSSDWGGGHVKENGKGQWASLGPGDKETKNVKGQKRTAVAKMAGLYREEQLG